MNAKKHVKKRKYSEDFLKFAFTYIIDRNIERPQCVICNEILSPESMKPNKLKRHFETKHLSYADKDISYFKHKAECVRNSRIDYDGRFYQQNLKATEVSYLVSLKIAKAKNHTTLQKSYYFLLQKTWLKYY